MIIQSEGGLFVFLRDRWVGYEYRRMVSRTLTLLG